MIPVEGRVSVSGAEFADGETMHAWARDLFPICRSLTGPGVRSTLDYLGDRLQGLQRHRIATGVEVGDWAIPQEWEIRDAYIADMAGRRLVDFADSNLHVVGYSMPVDAVMDRAELDGHLHSLPDQPTAIPYVTSYYSPGWGFCLKQVQRDQLGDGPFRVFIDAEFRDGHLDYADLLIPGGTTDEVLLSTYICHPSMANNELSGPVVLAALGQWLASLPSRRYTYRLLFAPETIGSISYLSNHLDHLRSRVRAGWVLTCMGDDRAYSYVASRKGTSLADRVSRRVLEDEFAPYRSYTFLERGSDERQWCAPGVDLPVCSIMRTKYGEFPEYHTSLDDLDFVTPAGLQGGFDVIRRCIEVLESNVTWRAITVGEPQMGRRGLYPNISRKDRALEARKLMNVLAYCDGEHDVLALCDVTGLPVSEVLATCKTLAQENLVCVEP